MKFINPKVDYAFKKIFGSEQSKEILISFLNAIIYDGEKTIKDLTIVNPFNPGKIISLKETYLDVKAVLVDGSIVIIEMQVARMTAFNKRVAYNLSKAYANQLDKGENYPLLNPAIAVTITDFILFYNTDDNISKDDYINKFVFQEETKKLKCLEKELRLIFVELPKFNKSLSELNSLTDKWIYFLKEAASFDEIPESLGEVAEIEQALNIANFINMSPEELEIVENRGIAMQDERGRIAYAEEIARLNQTIALIKLLITQRFGEVSEKINSQIKDLPLADVEDLVKVFLSFNSLADLESWLQERLI
ncbi:MULTISPECIES: Rpn family recombination-promoting nuclease/putative transposase [unclassified Okeania]|uniref:Rpn family recombination-promoting nuclease/putative transposase n=1 Tax=unclassified Okeania TaxID=2634635 RepID=UPI0013BDA04C|nr:MULTISPECIES: Rpn family recombination-promoting nuclease/putative transposase [unclassified Okeania]NET12208.1 Rpn family recombination-promoting nuclease/putative transposase [Okeania sp. SIO1H6]NES75448.1 Rpn family recombination-promoting nuclease/putative transposase [Okeania sp. SIO1H4]NET17871.1 Rpn family recombination-promoting nuclease/putative transposase [Okeania sp. SIO1H5]NET77308.1 Rpn family recombination-promoting nuclease/putative transposase [Okeania sp. SIO1F9]NET92731.1